MDDPSANGIYQGKTATMVTRYALAVFHYALEGKDWIHQMNFLSADDVCRWNSNFRTGDSTTSIVVLGVFCDSAGGQLDGKHAHNLYGMDLRKLLPDVVPW